MSAQSKNIYLQFTKKQKLGFDVKKEKEYEGNYGCFPWEKENFTDYFPVCHCYCVYSTRIKKWTGWKIYGKTINAAFFEVWRREIDKRKLNSKLRRMENKTKQDKDAAADYPL